MTRKTRKTSHNFLFFLHYLAKIGLKKIFLALLIALFIICNPQISLSQAPVQNPSPQILVEQGKKLYETGQLTDAVIVLQKAVTEFKAQGDKLGEAMTLSNLSLVFKKLGQLEKAEIKITESLNILSKLELKSDRNTLKMLAEALEIQGQIQLELGKAAQAIDSGKESANTYQSIKDEFGITRSLINQSIAQQALGFYSQSQSILEEISPRLQKQPDTLIKARFLRSFGDTLQLVGNLENSDKLLQQSLNIAKKLQSPPEISATLISLGNAQVALSKREISPNQIINYDEFTPLDCKGSKTVTQSSASIKFYNRAGEFYTEAANTSISPLLQVQAKLNQLTVLQELRNWSEAQKLSVEIESKLKKIGINQASIYAQINLAKSSICRKKANNVNIPTWKEIAQELADSVQQARRIQDGRSEAYALGLLGGVYLETQDISNAQQLTEQALFVAQAIHAPDINYLWQWQLGYILKAKDDKDNAINYYIEAVNSLKSLRSDLVALNPDIQFSFRDNVEPIYRQFVDLLLQPETDKNKSNSNLEINQKNLVLAREALESLQLSELENFFREACLLPKPKQIDDVVDKTDLTAAVIYPIILKDRLEIILKLPNQTKLRHYTTYKSANIVEDTLEKLQLYLKEPDRINNVKNLASQIYQWLIQPLESDLTNQTIETLVFVLDGSLRNIPMGVTYDEKKGEYLIQKYALALAPGLQLIDPKVLQRQNLEVLAGGVSEKRQIGGRNFASLENVKTELDRVQTAIPKSRELLNQDFTKINIQNQIQKIPYTVVHIASHGEFSSNADKTFILAWEQLLKVRDFDKLLRLRGQTESRAVELLVLSACQTASGDKRATLGLAGIAVRAGARSTVATLWSVNDESTAQLMTKFYQELANTSLSKAEALRQAQINILTKYEAPYFWAPYILVGNWL